MPSPDFQGSFHNLAPKSASAPAHLLRGLQCSVLQAEAQPPLSLLSCPSEPCLARFLCLAPLLVIPLPAPFLVGSPSWIEEPCPNQLLWRTQVPGSSEYKPRHQLTSSFSYSGFRAQHGPSQDTPASSFYFSSSGFTKGDSESTFSSVCCAVSQRALSVLQH